MKHFISLCPVSGDANTDDLESLQSGCMFERPIVISPGGAEAENI